MVELMRQVRRGLDRKLHDANGAQLKANDNWIDSPNKQFIINTTIPPTNDLESAIMRTLSPANYTAIVRGAGGTTGIAVVEVYALAPPTQKSVQIK